MIGVLLHSRLGERASDPELEHVDTVWAQRRGDGAEKVCWPSSLDHGLVFFMELSIERVLFLQIPVAIVILSFFDLVY